MSNYKKEEKNSTAIHLLDNDNFIQWIISSSPEVDNYWRTLMDKNPSQKEIITCLMKIMEQIDIEEERLSSEDKQKMWAAIEEACVTFKKKRYQRTLIRSFAAAASILLIVSIFFLVDIPYSLKSRNKTIDYKKIASSAKEKAQSPNNILLVLSNQEKIEIGEEKAELVYDKEGNVVVNSDAQYSRQSGEESEKIPLNQLITPAGKSSNITLSDGSKIWINSGSLLIYPVTFGKQQREIYVEGEIYLEVAKDDKVPFIVKTEKLEIEVLGTKFNVSAYKGDMSQSVVLATGSVSVTKLNDNKSAVKISPNQRYIYNTEHNQIELENVDVNDFICWRYGFLRFKSEKLSVVLQKLERYYDINISYSTGKVNDFLVSGKLDLKDSFEDVIKAVAVTAPIRYEIKDNYVKIDVKP